MIELTILEYLKDNLDASVYLEEPTEKPDRYVLFEKTSSGKNNQLRLATFAFQSYANSLYEAAHLNEKLKTVLDEMGELDYFGRVKLNSDYNFTDTTTKRYRYQAVYDFVY